MQQMVGLLHGLVDAEESRASNTSGRLERLQVAEEELRSLLDAQAQEERVWATLWLVVVGMVGAVLFLNCLRLLGTPKVSLSVCSLAFSVRNVIVL